MRGKEGNPERSLIESIFRAAPVGIGVVMDRILMEVNERVCQMVGYNEKELVGKSARMLYPDEEEFLKVGRLKYEEISEKGTGSVETVWKKKDGSFIDVLLSSSPIDPSDHDKGISFTALDITDSKRAVSELKKNEERFRLLFDTMVQGIVYLNYQGVILECNHAAQIILGLSKEEILGTNAIETSWIVYNEKEKEIRLTDIPELSRFSRNEAISNLILGLRNPSDQVVRWLRVHAVPMQLSVDQGTGIIFVSFEDITDKRASEEAIEKMHRELDLFFNTAVDLLCIADTDGYFRRLNPEWESTLGFPLSELEGKKFLDLVHPEDLENTTAAISQLIDQKKIQNFTNRYRCRDGSYRYIEWRSTPSGKLIFAAARDITERYEYEAKLKKARDKAEESDKLKSAFLANMSHEIRTPMNGVIGFAELLKEPGLPVERRSAYIDIINESSHQLLRIINDILDISKIETGQIELHMSIFSLNKLLDDLYSFFYSQATRKKITLIVEKSEPYQNSMIRADETKLHQIFSNLIHNAIKFTHQGHVRFGYKLQGAEFILYVEDTGIGIPPEKQNIIFDRFSQLENNLSGKNTGTGLGLSISKAYIEKMGGNLSLESFPGTGSIFRFNLQRTSVLIQQNNHLIQEPITDLSNLTILLVEDNEANTEFYHELLCPYCKKLIHAPDAASTLKILDNTVPDVILLDVKLPDMNGYALAGEIRKRLPKVPVIAQTAYAMSGEKEKAIEAGCNDYISKPVRPAILLSKISKLILKE